MAKSKKKSGGTPQTLGPDSYIRQFGRSLSLEACYINGDWDQHGMANIVLVRSKKSGKKVVGVYLVDVYCLGLKNTFYRIDLPEDEIENLISGITGGVEHLTIEPDMAFNIIYGGIEYAEDLGFSPHKDFKVSEYLLPDVDDVPYMDIEFGRNGRPFLMLGPNDNLGKLSSILNKSVGPDGYDFVRPGGF